MMSKINLSACVAIVSIISTCSPPDQNQSDLFKAGESRGKVSNKLEEASGLVASVRNPGYLWTLNDSGNPAEIFLLDEDANIVMTCKLARVDNRDWEDIAIGPRNGKQDPYLYIGEIGDNEARYDFKYLYVFPEPKFEADPEMKIENFDTLVVELPDGKRDMESITIDPENGDLYFISKREEKVNVYWKSQEVDMDTISPQVIAVLPFQNMVAADFSPDGTEMLMKTYDEVLYWKRSNGMTVQQMLMQEPVKLTYRREVQGEAIAWATDRSGFYTLSESDAHKKADLLFYKRN